MFAFCLCSIMITEWSCFVSVYPRSQSGPVWCGFFARPSVGNWTTLNLAVRARPVPGNNKTYLTASGYQDCFFLSQKYTPFVKLEDIESIGKKMKSFLGVFFLPEWEYQREGEAKKASHHVPAGSAVEFSSWQRWVPAARKSEKINSELPSKANSALVGKSIGTRLHSEAGVHVC